MRFTISPSQHFSVNIGLKVLIFVIKVQDPMVRQTKHFDRMVRPSLAPNHLLLSSSFPGCASCFQSRDITSLYRLIDQGEASHSFHLSHNPAGGSSAKMSVFGPEPTRIHILSLIRGTAVPVTVPIWKPSARTLAQCGSARACTPTAPI